MNLIDKFSQLGVDYKPHSSKGDEVWINCPFCEEEGTTQDYRMRCGINTVTLKLHCFNCGKSSSDFEYTTAELERVLGTGSLQASKRKPLKPKKEIRLPEDFQQVSYVHREDHWNQVAAKYLKQRNISAVQIRRKNIGYSTAGEFRFRIVIPVYYQEKLEGIVARSFVQDLEPKYKNSMGQKVVYNLPSVPKHKVILSEGAFDALAIERCTRSMDSGAVLGHALTDKQMQQLEPYKEVALWPDPDEAGIQGFLRMAKQLKEQGKVVSMVVPEFGGKLEYDPSELDVVELNAKLRQLTLFTPELEDHLKNEMAFQDIW